MFIYLFLPAVMKPGGKQAEKLLRATQTAGKKKINHIQTAVCCFQGQHQDKTAYKHIDAYIPLFSLTFLWGLTVPALGLHPNRATLPIIPPPPSPSHSSISHSAHRTGRLSCWLTTKLMFACRDLFFLIASKILLISDWGPSLRGL